MEATSFGIPYKPFLQHSFIDENPLKLLPRHSYTLQNGKFMLAGDDSGENRINVIEQTDKRDYEAQAIASV